VENILKITLATSNPHKVEEINLIAKKHDIEFILPDGDFDPVEDGNNFIQNAYCKAKCAAKRAKTALCLADDSGLCIEALNGEPGIYSARYELTPEKRIEKVLAKMKDVKERSAHFSCAMVLVNKKEEIVFKTEQKCFGSILEAPIGQNGFGYDPIFFVSDVKKGMAQLTPEEKALVSHRSKALNEVLKYLSL